MAMTSNIVIVILSEDNDISGRLKERFPFLNNVTVTNPELYEGIYKLSIVCNFEKNEADIRVLLNALIRDFGSSCVTWYKC